MHACMYACMHACMYVCMHACMYVCMYACMYVCVRACVCVFVCMTVDIYLTVENVRQLRMSAVDCAAVTAAVSAGLGGQGLGHRG